MTNPVIPVEAVEAAAKAVYEDTFGKSWEDESEDYRNELRETQRLALEAAAPYMLAEAWDEGGRAATGTYDTGYPSRNPYRTPDAR